MLMSVVIFGMSFTNVNHTKLNEDKDTVALFMLLSRFSEDKVWCLAPHSTTENSKKL